MKDIEMSVITGMHRSGTTFLGQILAKYSKTIVLHEPLNQEYGVSGVNHVYPCDLSLEQANYYIRLLDSTLKGNVKCVKKVEGDRLLKGVLRKFVGGRTGVDIKKYILHRAFGTVDRAVLKDPFLLMMTSRLLKENQRVIVVLRHPAAVWLSLKRMSWKFSFLLFSCDKAIEEFAGGKTRYDLERLTEIEKFSWLWRILYSYIDSLDKEYLLIKHENVCRNPYDEIERIEKYLNLPSENAPRYFIKENMFGETVTANSNKLHVFSRNSEALANAWRSKILKEDEIIIAGITSDLVEKFYGSW